MDQDSAALALLDELDLGSARGGRKPTSPMSVRVVGALTERDLDELASPGSVASPGQKLLAIRHSHHQLAQLLAKGCQQEEASLITGYSPAYISTLKNDPAFCELLTYYGKEREAIFVDVLERMRVLGISSLEMLQAKLDDTNEVWSKRELMEMADLLLLKPGQQRGGQFGGGGGAAPAVSVNVKFVTASPTSPDLTAGSVDVQFEDLPSD